MANNQPVDFGNVPAPPAPSQCDPGGGLLYSQNGTPYWLDSRGVAWNLTQGSGSGVTSVTAGDTSIVAGWAAK